MCLIGCQLLISKLVTLLLCPFYQNLFVLRIYAVDVHCVNIVTLKL